MKKFLILLLLAFSFSLSFAQEDSPDEIAFKLIHQLPQGTTVEELHSVGMQELDASPMVVWETITDSILQVQQEIGDAAYVVTQIELILPEEALPPDFQLPTFMVATDFASGIMNFEISELEIDKISWAGTKGSLKFDDIKYPHSISIHFPETSYSSRRESASFKNVSINIENLDNKLYSSFELKVGNFSFREREKSISIDNLSISLKPEDNNDSINYSFSLNLGKTALNEPGNVINFDHFALQFGFVGLDKNVLAQLENNLEKVQNINPEAVQNFMEESMELLGELLKKSPQVFIDQELLNQQGQEKLALNISIDHENMEGFDPESLQQAVQVEGKFFISQSLLVYIVDITVSQEFAYREFSSEEERAAQVEEETNRRISELLSQNMLIEQDDHFIAEFTFSQGTFTLNGNEIK